MTPKENRQLVLTKHPNAKMVRVIFPENRGYGYQVVDGKKKLNPVCYSREMAWSKAANGGK